MRFVTHRPRYTIGSPPGDFPPIEAVLYADAECEVYLLESARAGDLLLVGVRQQDAGSAPDRDQLHDRLGHHGCEYVGTPALSSDFLDVVVRVYGAWMAEIPALPLTERALYALLVALIDLGTDAMQAGLTAVPTRPLLWIEDPLEVKRLSSVCVRAGSGHEAEVVHQIGQTFLWAATGISSLEMESVPDERRLSSWCQNADAGLSDVVSRCISAPDSIATLHDLRRLVASSFLHLAETKPSIGLTAHQYINLSPYRYLWIQRSERIRL